MCLKPFVSMCLFGGTETFGGGPGDVFNPAYVFGGGLGGRYIGITFVTSVQVASIRNFRSDFVSQTQWSEETLKIVGTNLLVELGYRFRSSPKLWLEPFLGIRLTALGDADTGPAVNWDWGDMTDINPCAGTRVKWRTAGRKECQGVGYLFAEMRLSLLRFGEGELGNGYSVQVLIGYGGDRP